MPELPEVETIRRIVERELTGKEVACVVVRLPKLLRDSPLPTLDELVGRTVLTAHRRAKVLVIDVSGGLSLMAHFKLAGQVAVIHGDGARHVAGHPVPDPVGPYPHKATHVELHFLGGTVLFVSDIRQFGWLRLMPTASIAGVLSSFRFGPEAVGPRMISVEALEERLARRSIPIKLALLDQTMLAGLGNIYVDEALHFARIHPETPANAINGDRLPLLHEAVAWALENGILQGGAKIIHGKAYPIDGFPRVHGRQGEPCVSCGVPVVKIRVGARGTYLCPACQPVVDGAVTGKSRNRR